MHSDRVCIATGYAYPTALKEITLKALANSSPGRGPHAGSPRGVEVFALKPWVQKSRNRLFANSEGVAKILRLRNHDATPSELRLLEMNGVFPGLPRRDPGLELANAFSVKLMGKLKGFTRLTLP